MRKINNKDRRVIKNTTKLVLVFVAAVLAFVISSLLPLQDVYLQPGDNIRGIIDLFSLAISLGLFISLILVLFVAYYLYEHNMD